MTKEININSTVLKSVTFNPSLETHSINIRELCSAIENKQLVQPFYLEKFNKMLKREKHKWSATDMCRLFYTQLFENFPVSQITVNVFENDQDLKRYSDILKNVQEIEYKRGTKLLLDGYERLNTNYMAYINDPSVSHIYLDLYNGLFTVKDEPEKGLIPVGVLYNKDDSVLSSYIKDREELQSFEIYQLLLNIRSKHFGYFYSVNQATDLDLSSQLAWYAYLNCNKTL